MGRVFEALGASAGLVISYTIINDFYKKQRRKITGMLMLAFAIVPGIAVLLGGLIAQYLDWVYCFYFLLIYGLILIIPVWHLPETLLEKDLHALKIKNMFQGYLKEINNKQLIGFAICSGLSSGCIYVFGAEGPFIGIHLLGIQPATYGLLGLIPYLGTLIGSLLVVRLTRLSAILVLKIAFALEALAAFVMLILFSLHIVSLLTLLGPMILLCMGHPILAGTAAALGMAIALNKAFGSAVLNFTSMSVAMLVTFILSMIHIKSPIILPIMFIFALMMMIITYTVSKLGKVKVL